MNFTVEFYYTSDGNSPIEEFLSSLDIKMRAKIVSLMEVLEEKGTTLRMPYSEHLDDGIFELRCKLGSNITRSLYFFYNNGRIIFTNGFVKKSQKTPKNVITLAKQYRKNFLEREGY